MTEILITSSVLIAVLLALRKVFRNILSRRVQYALWGLVLARLLVPASLPAADFSVLTAAKPVQQTVARTITAQPVYIPVARASLAEHPTAPDTAPEKIAEIAEGESVWVIRTDETAVQYKRLSARTVLTYAWLAGSGAAAVFLLAVNLRFRHKLRRARRPFPAEDCALPVYLVETGLSSPCLFGLPRPAIYLTPAAAASPERLRHVLAHEMTHARHLDHIWTLLRGICLAVYWFDPLVWAASAAAKTDCELACDEGALARLEEADRIPYGQTLLSLIPVKRAGSPMLAATTMAAGKKQLKDRFTRIAQKPRQLMAAAVAAALLAGMVSACTFTQATTPDISLPKPQEDAGPAALTGEELRFFNESFFNGDPVYDEHGSYIPYTIVNQFASPWYPYDDVKDINLFELFYCEGSTKLSAEELQAALGVENELDLPCLAYKLTAAEMDRVLTQYTGLTLEQTNKAGLDSFTYLPDYNAYYWMHGDTNYCGSLDFTLGVREGETVRLYQGGNSQWTCVTLEEQEDGSWWFKSNQACERPVIPTPMPAGEPDVIIPLDGLEPYEAPAVTLETRTDDFEDTYENRLQNWDIEGHNVVVYRDRKGGINAAIRDRESNTVEVFLSDLSESASVFYYNDLFGRSGFTVSYSGQIGPHAYGTIVDYYRFTEDGALALLARTRNGFDQPLALDLDGDGADELVSEQEIFFQRDGQLYRADLKELSQKHCPALDFWDYGSWDRYSRSLFISAYSAERYTPSRLYFDGGRLLLYKEKKSHHDHMVDGADRYVPGEVISAAKDYVEKEVLEAQPDGSWRHAGWRDEGYPQETYDDWRIENVSSAYTATVGDITVECWYFNYELHTTTPEKVVLAGGKYLTEDDWVSPGYPNCDWLFFRVEGEKRTFLWHSMINDMSPGSEAFREHLEQNLARRGLGG